MAILTSLDSTIYNKNVIHFHVNKIIEILSVNVVEIFIHRLQSHRLIVFFYDIILNCFVHGSSKPQPSFI